MRIRGYAVLVGANALALTLFALPAVHGKGKAASAQTPASSKQATPAATEACGPTQGQFSEENFKTITSELASNMAEIRRQVAREVSEMDPDRLARLEEVKAAMASAQQEIQSNQKEIEEQAREMAAQVGPKVEVEKVWIDAGEESGWLGVEISEVTAEKAKELNLPAIRGVLVTEVEANSPAAKAGLKANDVIASYERQDIEGTLQFRRMVRETPPGRSIELQIWREGKTEKISVEVGNRTMTMTRGMKDMKPFVLEMPPMDQVMEMPRFEFGITPQLGVSAEDVSGQLGSYFGAPGDEGVLVREVRPETPAEKAGLKAGDIIFKVDDQPVKTVNQLRERLRAKREQKTVAIGIIRKGAQVSVNVELQTPKPAEHTRIARRAAL
jgi:serine protease Do